jgi:hypothetical protein
MFQRERLLSIAFLKYEGPVAFLEMMVEMFDNLVNFQDFVHLITGRALAASGSCRVACWAAGRAPSRPSGNPPRSRRSRSGTFPRYYQRANRLVSGDPQVDYIAYITRKYLAGRSLAGLSLGCGAGHKELRWASCGNFARLDAYDLTPQRIAAAKAEARARGVANVHFHIGDVYRLDWPSGQYDVVLGDQSLHHFAPIESLYANIRRA